MPFVTTSLATPVGNLANPKGLVRCAGAVADPVAAG
uniref:Uncharacterized protein n=1 Tax=Mycobacterium riyadhense TaxID=486698 RepID=A0A653EF92_9MYCO|nr:hypothetical protein BIN_B_00759 [Mycobacterium riyadhense]